MNRKINTFGSQFSIERLDGFEIWIVFENGCPVLEKPKKASFKLTANLRTDEKFETNLDQIEDFFLHNQWRLQFGSDHGLEIL